MKKVNLKKNRTELGLTITALSTLANVSTTVINQTGRMFTNPTRVTKNKIINGLNAEELSSGKNGNIKMFSLMMGNDWQMSFECYSALPLILLIGC